MVTYNLYTYLLTKMDDFNIKSFDKFQMKSKINFWNNFLNDKTGKEQNIVNFQFLN